MSVTIKVIFFAKARELARKQSDFLSVPATVSYTNLLDIIAEKYSLVEIKKNVILSINEEFCDREANNLKLEEGYEVAVIPPLSGGEKISVGEISELVASNSCGAISLFVGTTRDNFEGKEVVTLEYEAYEGMGIKCFETIAKDIRNKWQSVENIAIYHRLGTVPVKEASIVIAVSSPHRNDAMQATEWCINTIKSSAPIWKKEIYSDSKPAWKENMEFKPHPPKLKKYDPVIEQPVQMVSISPHLVQVKATKDDIDNRIEKFMERKKQELNIINIREFCNSEKQTEFSCARVDAILQKRKDSKSHLEVHKVLNSYHYRDQTNSDYLRKHIPSNGVEERLENLECQLSLHTPTPRNIYRRLKLLEDRILHLESLSPEYIQLWERASGNNQKAVKKKIFSIEEIDGLISELEQRISTQNGVHNH